MEPCAPGITLDYLGYPVPSECVNVLYCLHFNFQIYCFHRLLTPEVSVEEVTFWMQYASHLEN